MSKRQPAIADKFEVDSLLVLLESQDEQMRDLFAKAINLYVAPGAEDLGDKIKEDRLKQFIEDSLK